MPVESPPSIPTLREFREGRGITLEALALLGGGDPATTSRIERGLVKARPATEVRIARALGVSAKRMHQIVMRSREVALLGEGGGQ